MYTASLLFTLALVATTLSLPLALPEVNTVWVTDNVVVYATVTVQPGDNNAPPATQAPPTTVVTPTSAPAPPVATPTSTPPITTPTVTPSSTPSSAPSSSASVKEGAFAELKASAPASSPSSTKAAVPTSTSAASHSSAASSAAISVAATPTSVIQGGSGALTNGPALTVTLINQYGKAISTSHADNAGAAATGVNGDNVKPGTLATGATAVFAVPTGWGGNVFIADAAHEISDNDSLLEGSYGNQMGSIQTDIDVSYVNGFSVPILCKCHNKNKANQFTKVTGCNIDLFSQAGCSNSGGTGNCGKCTIQPDGTGGLDGNGACKNPKRGSGATDANVIPDPFFEPCSGQAYLFPFDGDGGNNGNSVCSGSVTCCVGTSCS